MTPGISKRATTKSDLFLNLTKNIILWWACKLKAVHSTHVQTRMKEDSVNKICVPRMMEHTYIPSTQEAQVEGCQLEASLGYIENFLEKTKQNKQPNIKTHPKKNIKRFILIFKRELSWFGILLTKSMISAISSLLAWSGWLLCKIQISVIFLWYEKPRGSW